MKTEEKKKRTFVAMRVRCVALRACTKSERVERKKNKNMKMRELKQSDRVVRVRNKEEEEE
jgi:hypothetical protein